MTKDEALWQALDALEIYGAQAPAVRQTIAAIKEALAQDEQSLSQEPVAWMDAHQPWDLYKNKPQFDAVPLYTTSPKEQQSCDKRPWVGLTDEEASWCQAPSTIQTWKRIEVKLKEKNT